MKDIKRLISSTNKVAVLIRWSYNVFDLIKKFCFIKFGNMRIRFPHLNLEWSVVRSAIIKFQDNSLKKVKLFYIYRWLQKIYPFVFKKSAQNNAKYNFLIIENLNLSHIHNIFNTRFVYKLTEEEWGCCNNISSLNSSLQLYFYDHQSVAEIFCQL